MFYELLNHLGNYRKTYSIVSGLLLAGFEYWWFLTPGFWHWQVIPVAISSVVLGAALAARGD